VNVAGRSEQGAQRREQRARRREERRRQRRRIWVTGTPWQGKPLPTPADGPDPYGDPDPEWMRIDWHGHLRRIELDTSSFEPHPGSSIDPTRTELNYVEMGEGEPLVMIHGLGGCWQNWLENIPHFARRWRVIAPDLSGFGESPMPGWEITISAYGKLIASLLERLDTGPASLVGNSMGGFVSAEVTVAQPTWVKRLALVSAAGVSHARMYRAPAATLGRMARTAAPLAVRYRERTFTRPGLRHRVFRNLFYKPNALRPELIWEITNPGIESPALVAAIRALAGYDILDRLEDVEIPTLIVWGQNDYVVPPNDAHEFARLMPHAELHVFNRTGHLPMAERPVRFNRLLERFLDRGPERPRA
jgi:pimeloyl-ACP methyl ester carboxylesterase